MSNTGNKIRIYDLAKELKLDNKRVIEDARREGVDVNVPSNTLPADVADRIRTKYFPKKAAPQHGPRLVKHARPIEHPSTGQLLEPAEHVQVARTPRRSKRHANRSLPSPNTLDREFEYSRRRRRHLLHQRRSSQRSQSLPRHPSLAQ